jgi:hypothetical protein
MVTFKAHSLFVFCHAAACAQSDAMKQAADAVEKFSEEKAISKEIKVRAFSSVPPPPHCG